MGDFTKTEDRLPPKDVLIEWLTPSGRIVRGKYAGGAVWFPEATAMYVYYTPICWRPALTAA